MPHIVNSRCVLAVRNLEASTAYFVSALGFQKDPVDAAGWSFLTRDTFRVMLGECPDVAPAHELGDHSYFAYWNVDAVDEFYQELVDAVDEFYQELVGRGAIVSSAPTDKPWG